MMINKSLPQAETIFRINIATSAQVTDFQYNNNGTLIAVSDSDGNLFIYQRQKETQFAIVTTLRVNDAPIWKISWADPAYGSVIGIGTFNRKVLVFRLKDNELSQIAFHQLHEGSVNHVEWAAGLGLKLFSGGSDGGVAILELRNNSWISSIFYAHQCPIYSLSLRPMALNESEEKKCRYPMIVTGAKDGSIKIWKHTSDISEELLEQNARIYQQIACISLHQLPLRQVIWRAEWSQVFPDQYNIITCSEDGFVRIVNFKENKFVKSKIICHYESPIYRISQSITGNILSVSTGSETFTYICEQISSQEQWKFVSQLK